MHLQHVLDHSARLQRGSPASWRAAARATANALRTRLGTSIVRRPAGRIAAAIWRRRRPTSRCSIFPHATFSSRLLFIFTMAQRWRGRLRDPRWSTLCMWSGGRNECRPSGIQATKNSGQSIWWRTRDWNNVVGMLRRWQALFFTNTHTNAWVRKTFVFYGISSLSSIWVWKTYLECLDDDRHNCSQTHVCGLLVFCEIFMNIIIPAKNVRWIHHKHNRLW